VRLNKFISETGACSRREADDWITSGRVTVNGLRADLGTQIEAGDQVALDGAVIGAASDRPRAVYIALNKPVGITCTTERHIDGNIIDFVDHSERVFPIGRLDKESEGLILLTNDGDIVNEVLRAEHNHEKEYLVAVDRSITDEFVTHMSRGVRIDAGMTRPCKLAAVSARSFRIVLTQGLNRQIRKMCEALGYQVVALQRVRIMHIELGHLKLGRWRNLTDAEVAALRPRDDRGRLATKPTAPARPAAKPKPKPTAIPFGQPGAPGGPARTDRGRPARGGGPRRGR
jgi:23S rRNA pseudouridine2604 synthase